MSISEQRSRQRSILCRLQTQSAYDFAQEKYLAFKTKKISCLQNKGKGELAHI